MNFSDFKNSIPFLQKSILGGVQTQFQLAPTYRKPYDLAKVKANNPTKAAVLVLFYPNANNKTSFVLTKRADYDGHHANQISFPGGKHDPKDNQLIDTALRETKEEIGISIAATSIFKKLTEVFIPPSNFIVQPYLAYIDSTPKFSINYEVDQIIAPTIVDLMDVNNQKTTLIQSTQGKNLDTPYFSLQGEIVWGATAMMLSELRDLLLKTPL